MEYDSILHQFGGIDTNNLVKKISRYNDLNSVESEIENIVNSLSLTETSKYYTSSELIDFIKDKNHDFNLLSLNIDSLNANFDTLLIYLDSLREMNFEFDVICLQQTYMSEYNGEYELQGYNSFHFSRLCSTEGGLITYISDKHEINELN